MKPTLGFIYAYVPVFRGVLLCPSTEKSRKLDLEASGSTDTLLSVYTSARFCVDEHLNLHLSQCVCVCVGGCLRE